MSELKKVVISSVASCDPSIKQGHYEAMLEYKSARKFIRRNISETTVNRCIIYGLIDGVELLKEPCAVTLVTSTKIGVKGKGGVNADLIARLIASLESRECAYDFEVKDGKSVNLKGDIHHAMSSSGKTFSEAETAEPLVDEKQSPVLALSLEETE